MVGHGGSIVWVPNGIFGLKHELEAEQGFFVDSGALTWTEQESA